MASFDLDKCMNELNELMREQEELESRFNRAEWKLTNKDERTKLEQQIEEAGAIHHESFENNHIDLT